MKYLFSFILLLIAVTHAQDAFGEIPLNKIHIIDNPYENVEITRLYYLYFTIDDKLNWFLFANIGSFKDYPPTSDLKIHVDLDGLDFPEHLLFDTPTSENITTETLHLYMDPLTQQYFRRTDIYLEVDQPTSIAGGVDLTVHNHDYLSNVALKREFTTFGGNEQYFNQPILPLFATSSFAPVVIKPITASWYFYFDYPAMTAKTGLEIEDLEIVLFGSSPDVPFKVVLPGGYDLPTVYRPLSTETLIVNGYIQSRSSISGPWTPVGTKEFKVVKYFSGKVEITANNDDFDLEYGKSYLVTINGNNLPNEDRIVDYNFP